MNTVEAKWVYVVYHDFYSHDMFVVQSAKESHPKKFGSYDTKAEAEMHIREGMDDFIKKELVPVRVRRADPPMQGRRRGK